MSHDTQSTAALGRVLSWLASPKRTDAKQILSDLRHLVIEATVGVEKECGELVQQLQTLIQTDGQCDDAVIETVGWWQGKRAKSSEEPDPWEIPERCADQLAATLILKNLNSLNEWLQNDLGRILFRRFAERVIYHSVRRWDRTEHELQIVCEAIGKRAGKFQFLGRPQGIRYFQRVALDALKKHSELVANVPLSEFHNPVTTATDSAAAQSLDEDATQTTWELMICRLGRRYALRLWVLGSLRMARMKWEEVIRLLANDGWTGDWCFDPPPGITRDEVAAEFTEWAGDRGLTAANLRQFKSRSSRKLLKRKTTTQPPHQSDGVQTDADLPENDNGHAK